MKTIYLIPGFRHTINTQGYLELIEGIKSLGFEVIFIQIDWNSGSMLDYVSEAETKIEDRENVSVFGFSFGAMIALMLSKKIGFEKIYLASLSPYFSEDLSKMPFYYRFTLGLKRWKDFQENFSEKLFLKLTHNNYYIIYGSEETERLQKRAKRMIKILDIKNIRIVSGVTHDIGDTKYINKILEFID